MRAGVVEKIKQTTNKYRLWVMGLQNNGNSNVESDHRFECTFHFPKYKALLIIVSNYYSRISKFEMPLMLYNEIISKVQF